MPFAFAVVRLLLFVPLFIAAYTAVPIWFRVRANPAPVDALWGNDMYTGLVLGAAGTIFGCIENGLSFVPSGFATDGRVLLILLFLDTGAVGLISASISKQAKYLPGTLDGCNQYGDVPTQDASLFVFIASFYDSTSRGACRRLLLPWICMITTVAVYASLIACEIVYMFAKGRWKTPTNRSCAYFILGYTTLPIRLTTSYIRKFRRRQKAIEVNAFPLDRLPALLLCSCTGSNTPSSPTHQPQCWSCTRAICNNCKQVRSLPQPRQSAHLECCTPLCTHCHIFFLAGRRARIRDPEHVKKRPKVTLCPHSRAGMLLQGVERTVCGPCSVLPDSDLVEQRGHIEMDEIRTLEISRMMKCAGCEKRIGGRKGVRWWWCGVGVEAGCGIECRDEVHAAWAE